ncbi:MAG TPA: shikimate kinase [Candidatus Krumholzibacteria bacterium]|nr:shikimate kinase [Candidatus Krumholzibacteria bacterium]
MWTSFVGFMGCGKSTVTRLLQAATSRPLVSLDAEVESRAGRPIRAIFAAEGEPAFRRMELDALASLDPERSLVVDTGGGVVETPEAVALLRARGVVIWIDAPWELLRHRLQQKDDGTRPLVAQLGWAGLESLHRRRRRLYAAAADFRLRSGEGPAGDVARLAMLRSLIWERRREAERR